MRKVATRRRPPRRHRLHIGRVSHRPPAITVHPGPGLRHGCEQRPTAAERTDPFIIVSVACFSGHAPFCTRGRRITSEGSTRRRMMPGHHCSRPGFWTSLLCPRRQRRDGLNWHRPTPPSWGWRGGLRAPAFEQRPRECRLVYEHSFSELKQARRPAPVHRSWI